MKVLHRIKVIVLLVSSLSLTLTSGYAWADLKIGFINPIKVLETAPQAESARNELEKEFAQRKDDLEAEEAAVRRLDERLGRDSAVMSDSERQRLERDVLSRKRDLRRAKEEFREDLNLRRNDELAKLQKEILQVINQLAKEQGYDLIVGEGVIYASDAIDISDQVLERLRQTATKPSTAKQIKKTGE